ncbi:hypothetical protein [Sandarakinorhabdus oryzae]|uniref:hypothetical protein n=1 Tax=Sandarakinorhabdus oryzae TaxID=2675220 RepID=UPI0012E1FF65|nr:hypothetical protein [Sandarakinorhabdus oryzae]
MSKLTLRYRYDSSFFDPKQTRDDFGWLDVAVQTDRFSGEGGFWVQWQDVKEFGEALNVFPIVADSPITAQWGFEMLQGEDLRLRIEIAPANSRGDLSVRFEVADYDEPHNRLCGCFLTNYHDVDAFRAGIARLMDQEADEATLNGR